MGRWHLFEFEDQPWFPTFLRNYGTEFLQFLSNRTKLYRPAVPLLEATLTQLGTTRIIDLGSGSGGGWLWLSSELQKSIPELKIVLTDLFPNVAAFRRTQGLSDVFDAIEEPIDARKIPSDLNGLRTQFLSLHHFKPEDAVLILQNAVDSGEGIAIFEAQERSVASFIGMFISPITVLLTTPFIRPFRIGRIVFTYLIPLVPLFVWWDGMVSSLRTYSVKEMNELVTQVNGNETYQWNIGRIKSGPGVILHLIGIPK